MFTNDGAVYLVKEDNVTSEQTFSISIQFTTGFTFDFLPATLGEDYNISRAVQALSFLPSDSTINVPFVLLPDDVAEDVEEFLIRVVVEGIQDFTNIIIQDDDSEFECHNIIIIHTHNNYVHICI